jgi:hypothetical protein
MEIENKEWNVIVFNKVLTWFLILFPILLIGMIWKTGYEGILRKLFFSIVVVSIAFLTYYLGVKK